MDTGDPIPGDFDAVVMREDVHTEGDAVELRAAAAPYQHVRSIGEDVSAAELLLPAGHRLRPVDVAAAGAAGATELVVRRRPVVTVIPTGDEIRPVGSELGEGELPDTNSVMLAAQAEAVGCEAHRFEVVPDVPDEIAAAVRAAAARSDLVVVIAGSSAGRDDHTAAVVAEVGTLAVHGVAVRPGHPVVLGVVGRASAPPRPCSARPATRSRPRSPSTSSPRRCSPGCRARRRPSRPSRRRASPASWPRPWGWTTGCACGSAASAGSSWPPRSRAGPACSPRWCAPTGCSWCRPQLEGHHAGEEVSVRLLRGVGEIERTIVATGSHDLVLDLAASALRERDPRLTLASSNVGSLGGLTALRDGLCHVAGSHLLDPESGEYTLPYVERLLPGREVSVVRLVHREQGLIVAPGQSDRNSRASRTWPSGGFGTSIVSVGPARGCSWTTSSRGAASRRRRSTGYEREEHTHLAVAAAVAAGRADCGLGVLAAARAFGLDFVPVAQEPYDLVFEPDPILDPLWTLLESDDFRRAVTDLGGYDTAEMGRRIR